MRPGCSTSLENGCSSKLINNLTFRAHSLTISSSKRAIFNTSLSRSSTPQVAKMVDARDLKSLGLCRAGSSPALGTKLRPSKKRLIYPLLKGVINFHWMPNDRNNILDIRHFLKYPIGHPECLARLSFQFLQFLLERGNMDKRYLKIRYVAVNGQERETICKSSEAPEAIQELAARPNFAEIIDFQEITAVTEGRISARS